jgi:SAM-dependent methyltransferase
MPLTVLNTLLRFLDKDAQSILDVGCGKGDPMKFINRNGSFYTVGLDIFRPYLLEAKRSRSHQDYILCDVGIMPIKERAFDVVLCIEVLEHLRREDGVKLIKSMEKVARKQVIMTTPVNRYKQKAYDGNPYQEHKYVWSVDEIKRFGYSVKGAGMQGIPGEDGLVYKIPTFLKPILHILWVFMSVFTFYKPNYAGHMICIKLV